MGADMADSLYDRLRKTFQQALTECSATAPQAGLMEYIRGYVSVARGIEYFAEDSKLWSLKLARIR